MVRLNQKGKSSKLLKFIAPKFRHKDIRLDILEPGELQEYYLNFVGNNTSEKVKEEVSEYLGFYRYTLTEYKSTKMLLNILFPLGPLWFIIGILQCFKIIPVLVAGLMAENYITPFTQLATTLFGLSVCYVAITAYLKYDYLHHLVYKTKQGILLRKIHHCKLRDVDIFIKPTRSKGQIQTKERA